MTVKELITMLEQWKSPDHKVLIYDADSMKLEEVSGSIYDPEAKTVTLHSDDIS